MKKSSTAEKKKSLKDKVMGAVKGKAAPKQGGSDPVVGGAAGTSEGKVEANPVVKNSAELGQKPSKPESKPAKSKTSVAKKPSKKAKKEVSKFVVLESADDRVLEFQIGKEKFSGMSVKILRSREEDTRRILVEAGYLLK